MATRRIRYGTPGEFHAVTHAQLERFDNKPPLQPLEEPKSAAKSAKNGAKPGESNEAKNKSEAEKMRRSEGN